MLKKKSVWVALGIIAVLLVSGAVFYRSIYLPAHQQATDTPVKIATARKGELVISANGVGTVIAAQEIVVGFASSGVVAEIYVEVGDEVQAGEALAQQGNLKALELALASAERKFQAAQKALEDLYDELELVRANAQLAVSEAQVALEEAVRERSKMDGSRCTSEVIETYYYDWLEQNQYVEKIKTWGWLTGDMISAEEHQRDVYYMNYNWCTTPFSDLEKGTADVNVAIAEETLNLAEAELAKLSEGPDEEAVAQAEADVEIAAYNLEIAQENLEGATAVAPIRGTVMSINAQVGETVNGGFITIADLSTPKLEIYLDETDLAMVGVGYEVEVVFDALAEEVYTGYVTSVDPGLTSQGNMKVVRAEVELDKSTFSKPQTFPLGLSASVEVIGSRAKDAVLVPVEALRKLGEGEYAVFVMENGEPVLRMVEVGIMDYTYAQILSGVEENEIVTTGIVETE